MERVGCHGEREGEGERERVADTESENHLETLGQGFATIWTQVIAFQIQNSQTLVYLGHRMNCSKPRKSQKKKKN